MKLDLDANNGNLIRSFADDQVLVGHTFFREPVIVSMDSIIADWAPPPVESLSLADLRAALDLEPEVILLGTGPTQRRPPAAATAAVLRLGVGIEVMNTAAACRTYNVLASEYRRVVAALFIR
jgi:uncharacterized protein